MTLEPHVQGLDNQTSLERGPHVHDCRHHYGGASSSGGSRS